MPPPSRGEEEGNNLSKELEMVTTDMENRLRGTIVRLFQPAIGQFTDLGVQLTALETKVDKHAEILKDTATLRGEVEQQKDCSAVFSERLDKVERHAFELELSTSDTIQDLKYKVNEHQNTLTEVGSNIEKSQREISRIWEEAKRLQDQHDASTNKVWGGIADLNKTTERARGEIIKELEHMQHQHDELLDDLFGEGKGVTRLTQEFAHLSKFVAPIPEIEKTLRQYNERTGLLEGHQQAVMDSCHRNDEAFSGMRAEVEQKLKKMRDEFRQEANCMIAHNATQMRMLRNEVENECAATRKFREDVPQMQMNNDLQCKKLAEDLESERKRVDALHREITKDIEELHKRRKKDKTFWETGIDDFRKSQKQALDQSHQACLHVEFIGRIASLVLEGERLINTMYVQDFADRNAEWWLSLPKNQSRSPPSAPETIETLLLKKKQRGNGSQKNNDGNWDQFGDEIVSVDWRQGLAVRRYKPGQITYRGLNYDRMELLLLHHTLLQQAQTALEKGPPRISNVSLPNPNSPESPLSNDVVRMQKDATGEKYSGSKPASGDGEGTRPPPGLRSCGRQRPGSMGQPQAMGSRGTATEGPPLELPDEPFSSGVAKTVPGEPALADSSPLKLPAITGAGSILGNRASLTRTSLTAR